MGHLTKVQCMYVTQRGLAIIWLWCSSLHFCSNNHTRVYFNMIMIAMVYIGYCAKQWYVLDIAQITQPGFPPWPLTQNQHFHWITSCIWSICQLRSESAGVCKYHSSMSTSCTLGCHTLQTCKWRHHLRSGIRVSGSLCTWTWMIHSTP